MEHENPSFIQWWLGIIVFLSIWSKCLTHQVSTGWMEFIGPPWEQFLFGYLVGFFPWWFFMAFWFMAMEVLGDLYTLIFEKE
jgi:hypothetical protein